MHSHLYRFVLGAAAACALLAGCGSADQPTPSSTSAAPGSSTSELPPLPAEHPTEPGAIGVSPGGVTTKVDVPSDAGESQFGQACRAAKQWMNGQQGGETEALVESYLKVLQEPGTTNPGTFNTAWAELTPAQQAGVILAANMAATDQCG
ncbi:lipoprotein LpqV [Mycobacterium sp. NPDC003449]